MADEAESMADEAENAAKHGDYCTVYQNTNKLCGGAHMAQNIPVKDKEGNVLKTEKEQLIRWAEQFNELLNRPEPNKHPNFDLTNIQNLNIITEDITRDELEAVLKNVKNNKASGCLFLYNFLQYGLGNCNYSRPGPVCAGVRSHSL